MRPLPALLIALTAFAAQIARAGPPLLSDDPHTLGPGRVQAIVSLNGLGGGDVQVLAAPLFDLTLGVLEGLDLTLVVAPTFSFEPNLETDSSGTVSIGFKWQPIAGEHWNASFTPSATLSAPVLDQSVVLLPIEIEYTWTRLNLGMNIGYAIGIDGPDLLVGAVYGGFATNESLTWVAELWAGAHGVDHEQAIGVNLGFDWVTPWGPHLLAAAGPGYAWKVREEVRWYAFLGIQWDFSLWGAD